jgi:hypothetical protein
MGLQHLSIDQVSSIIAAFVFLGIFCFLRTAIEGRISASTNLDPNTSAYRPAWFHPEAEV